ncbi:type II toxin-antitoxin system PemK/MazF family toxin [Nitrospiraceae bacterium HYJII51-Mn-bac16s-1-B09]|uniref:mRNA interferase n=1 Tax=Candidatus Manganitrophus noduliformans TaxID=2606439 RepID=A0A7X6I9Z9_9BACT|nr:type II toxin-antitoxin system PemK/MazF family toxin [Candidatus Manganitrophus noduliformans]
MVSPARGDVWLADLNPTRGHEQAGQRPVLIVSEDLFNQGPAGLVIVLPITSTHRGIPAHVPVSPPEGGLKNASVILCDSIRSISKGRLSRRLGRVSGAVMEEVEDRIRILMAL